MNHIKEIRYELNISKENMKILLNYIRENKGNVTNNMNLFLVKMKDFNEILSDLKKLRQQVYSVKKIKENLSNNNELNELNEKLNTLINNKDSNESKLLSLKRTEEEKKEAYENTKELLGLKDAKLNSLIEQMNSKLLNIVELDSKIRSIKLIIEELVKEIKGNNLESDENENLDIKYFEENSIDIQNLNMEINNISIEIEGIIKENSSFETEYKSFIDGVQFFKQIFLEITEHSTIDKNDKRFNTIFNLNNTNSNSLNNSHVIDLCFSSENENKHQNFIIPTNNLICTEKFNMNMNMGNSNVEEIKKSSIYFTDDKGERSKALIKVLVYFGFYLISTIVKMNRKINDTEEVRLDTSNSK
jgi:hypothetical protein